MKKRYLLFSIILLANCTLLDPDDPGNLVPATVDEDPSLPSLEINGTNLHLYTYGNPANKKVFVLHGGPGMESLYMTKLKSLQDQFYVIFFDQRGCGLSRRHDPDIYTTDLYLSDLHALVRRFATPGEKVIMIGHSWGGIYATAYIDRYPNEVSQVIHLDSGAFAGSRQEATVTYKLSDAWVNDYVWNNEFFSNESHAKADYSLMVAIAGDPHPLYHFKDSDPMPWTRYGAVVSVALVAARSDKRGNPSYDHTKNLHLYAGDALFIRSGLNEIMDYEFHLLQMADYSNSSLVTVPNSGHDFIWTHYPQVESAIRAYLIP